MTRTIVAVGLLLAALSGCAATRTRAITSVDQLPPRVAALVEVAEKFREATTGDCTLVLSTAFTDDLLLVDHLERDGRRYTILHPGAAAVEQHALIIFDRAKDCDDRIVLRMEWGDEGWTLQLVKPTLKPAEGGT